MSERYILDENNQPVKEPSLERWAIWMENNHPRHVGWTQINSEITVSTVFLTLDHNFGFKKDGPILFETMVFGGNCDEYQCRHRTWEEAEAFHKMVVDELRARYIKQPANGEKGDG